MRERRVTGTNHDKSYQAARTDVVVPRVVSTPITPHVHQTDDGDDTGVTTNDKTSLKRNDTDPSLDGTISSTHGSRVSCAPSTSQIPP